MTDRFSLQEKKICANKQLACSKVDKNEKTITKKSNILYLFFYITLIINSIVETFFVVSVRHYKCRQKSVLISIKKKKLLKIKGQKI